MPRIVCSSPRMYACRNSATGESVFSAKSASFGIMPARSGTWRTAIVSRWMNGPVLALLNAVATAFEIASSNRSRRRIPGCDGGRDELVKFALVIRLGHRSQRRRKTFVRVAGPVAEKLEHNESAVLFRKFLARQRPSGLNFDGSKRRGRFNLGHDLIVTVGDQTLEFSRDCIVVRKCLPDAFLAFHQRVCCFE